MREVDDVQHTINQCEARGNEGVNTPHEDAIDDSRSDNGQVQDEFLVMRSMSVQMGCEVNSHETSNLTAKRSQVEVFYTNQKNSKAIQSGKPMLGIGLSGKLA
jgi:hypothetical protein